MNGSDLSSPENVALGHQQLLSRLKSERFGLEHDVDTPLPELPPALRLPPDLVETIFLDCFRDGLLSSTFPAKRNAATPLHLGHICRSWRTVALSIPHLWASLNVDFDRMSGDAACELLETWFSRSGEILPLSLTCSSAFNRRELMTTVFSYAHRWKYLNLVVPLSSFKPFALHTSDDLFRALETLVLRFTSCEPVEQISAFAGAPRLRTLLLPATARGGRVSPDLPYRALPLFQGHQITHFMSGHSFTPTETLDFFSRCPNLVDCSLAVTVEAGRRAEHSFRPTTTTRTGLSSLRKLQIKTWVELSGLFQSLELPALVDLELTGHTYLFADALTRMIQQSRCGLERFCLRDMITWPSEIVQCLREMPSLVELELSSPEEETVKEYLDDDALLQLTDRGRFPGSLLLPQLEVMRLDHTLRSDPSLLTDMLQSRWDLTREGGGAKQSARLRRVELELPARWSTLKGAAAERLACMKDEGLEVSMTIFRRSWASLIKDTDI
jgi:hypothetical protein